METEVPSYRIHLTPRGWRAEGIAMSNEGLGELPLMH